CGQFYWPKNHVECPHLTTLWRGQGHGLASFLLPTRLMRSRVALRHVARHWVQAKSTHLTCTGSAQAQAFHQAQSIPGPHAQAPLGTVSPRDWRDGSSTSATARSHALNDPPPSYCGHLNALLPPPRV